MTTLNVGALVPGDRVQHELRVAERDTRRTRNGDPFVILTLANRFGEIRTAPIWSDKLAWADGAEPGSVVQAVGEVRIYQDASGAKRQLELTAPLRVLPSQHVTLSEFLPSVEEPAEYLWAKLDKLRDDISSPPLRSVVGLLFDDDNFRIAFERAPASTRGHHASLGGLLRHVIEVTVIARTIANTMRSGGNSPANTDLVVAGAMLHDVGKVDSYSVSLAGFEYTAVGHLLGHVVAGSLMLDRRYREVAPRVCTEEQLLEVHHLILSHHGVLEFGSPVRPLTIEAEIVHWADEASAKSASMIEALASGDAFAPGATFSNRLWQVDNRRLWKRNHDWE